MKVFQKSAKCNDTYNPDKSREIIPVADGPFNPKDIKPSIYVINLDRRKDRLEDFSKLINSTVLTKLDLYRFSAIDGKDMVNDLKKKGYSNDPIIEAIANHREKLKPGELACLLSHYFCMKEAMKNEKLSENEFILLMEDDFFLGTNFDHRFENMLSQITDEMNFIYPGGRFCKDYCKIPKSDKRVTANIFTFGQGNRTTHAILIRKKILPNLTERIVDYIRAEKFFPIDCIYVCLTRDMSYNFFPHLFYSPMEYNSDIQGEVYTFPTESLLQ